MCSLDPGNGLSPTRDHHALECMRCDDFELSGAIVILASPSSDYIAGINLVGDGSFAIGHGKLHNGSMDGQFLKSREESAALW